MSAVDKENEQGMTSSHAFLWYNGKMMDLGVLPGDTNSQALCINNSGQVVGISKPSQRSGLAFCWQNGHMVDLNTLISASSGWVLEKAEGINNKGQIVGSGKHNGKDRAFLLTPK